MEGNKLKLTFDNVLIEPKDKPNQTESGAAFREGTVVAAGEGNWQMGVEFLPGDVVVYPAHAGQQYENKLILKAHDIVGIKSTEV